MRKWITAVIAILVIGTIFFFVAHFDKAGKPLVDSKRDLSLSLPLLSPPSLEIFSNNETFLAERVWATLQNYLEFARVHDLAGVRSLSYQISAVCNDFSKEKECFALMDSVYAFASPFKLSDFKHIQSDEKQIIMYTDGPTVSILYFTRDENFIKVLGMRFCLEDETTKGTCVETDPGKRDIDGNGWWDSVESLFYPHVTT